MRKPLAIGVATLAAVLSLGLAACGSDDDSSSNEDVLTNTELVQEADAICTKYNDELDTKANDAGLSADSSPEEIESFVSDEIVPLYEKQIDELRALQPNSDDEAAYTEIVDTLESELQAVEDDPAAAVESNDPFPEATKLANEFGLEVCGAS